MKPNLSNILPFLRSTRPDSDPSQTPAETSPTPKGTLVLIGGAEDKTFDKIVLRQTIACNEAKKAVVIPTASKYGVELGREYADLFERLGVNDNEVLDIVKRDDAFRSDYVEFVRQADLIFMTGGDQVKLVEALIDTPVLEAMRERFHAGATLAGTSAGAAASSDPMIYDGNRYGLHKGSLAHSEGFGFLQGVTIDTHFMIRGRIARLTQFLSSGHSRFGLGLGEDTAIMIRSDMIGEVIGSGVVTALSSKEMVYTNYDEIDEDDTITTDGLRLSFLGAGSVFDLKNWTYLVGPSKAKSDPSRIAS